MTKEEELSLAAAAASGDRGAFEELVNATQKQVYNLAYRMMGSEQDALDASQDAYLKAYLNLKRFRGDSRFSVWMYRITNNVCLDLLRKRSRSQEYPLVITDGDDGETDFDIPDVSAAPEELFERGEIRESVARAVKTLPESLRSALVMREYNGLSYEEIAQALDINIGTVKSRISRAREKIASILINDGTFPSGERQKTGKEEQ